MYYSITIWSLQMHFFLFLFIFKASSLARNITMSNWENFTGLPVANIINYNSNHDIQIIKKDPNFFKRNPPLFIFCFASWCPHCKKAHPGWEKFQEEVSGDSSFIAASINCSSDSDLCQSLKIRSLPTLITYFHGDIRETKCFLDVNSYKKVGNKLSLIQQERFIKRYDQIENKINEYEKHITFPRYPSFVFSFDYKSNIEKTSKSEIENINNNNIEVSDLNDYNLESNSTANISNDIEAMEIVSRVMIATDSYQDEYFYLNSTSTIENQTQKGERKRTAIVFIDDDVSIEMKSEFNFDNVLSFVKENCHKLFGEWSFMSLRSIKRRFAVYAPKVKKEKKEKKKDNKSNSKKYSKIIDSDVKKFAISNLNKYAWGSAKEFGEEQFNDIFKLKTSDYPAIVVIDIRLSQFAKLKKIKSHQEIENFFKSVENYEIETKDNDSNTKKDVQSIFEPLEVNNEMQDLLHLINSFAEIFITTLIILLLLSAIGFLIYCFYFKKPVPKYD